MRPVQDPAAEQRVLALKHQGLSLRKIAARKGFSPSGVRKMLKRAQATEAAALAAAAAPPPEAA